MVEDQIKQQLLKVIPKVETGFPLGSTRPLGIGGPARYYTVAADTVELVQAVKAACDAGIPYRVLGLGESTIIADGGYEGLIIQNASESYAVSQEQSQVVVDSGMPMRRLLTITANLELGGLLPLYAGGGSVGGALFSNNTHAHESKQQFADSLRSLTLLMPPTKIKPDPSIVRFKGTWLTTRVEDGQTKLSQAAERDGGRMPVILTAQIQLTSLRSDEIMRRMQQEVMAVRETEPPEDEAHRYFGPLFLPLPNVTLQEAFDASKVFGMSVSGLKMSSAYPNYATVTSAMFKKSELPVSVRRLEAFTTAVIEQVEKFFGAKLTPAFTIIGERDGAIPGNF